MLPLVTKYTQAGQNSLVALVVTYMEIGKSCRVSLVLILGTQVSLVLILGTLVFLLFPVMTQVLAYSNDDPCVMPCFLLLECASIFFTIIVGYTVLMSIVLTHWHLENIAVIWKSITFKRSLLIGVLNIASEITIGWMSLNLIKAQSTLVQVMATNH